MGFNLEELYILKDLIIERFYSGEEFIIGKDFTVPLIELGKKIENMIKEYDNIEKSLKENK